ncbi:Protein MAIN-LIKE 2 [Linum perenne]
MWGESRHRASLVWREPQACKALKLRQRSSALTFYPQYETFLRECGLYTVVSLLGQSPCKELVTALLERWRPETNTFHLLQGEATITLEDVEVLTGLPTRGRPVSVGYDARAADVICQELLGATPPPTRFTGHQVKISWVKEQFDRLPAGASADVITCYARAYAWVLVGAVLLADRSGDLIPVHLLRLLYFRVSVQDWGALFAEYSLLWEQRGAHIATGEITPDAVSHHFHDEYDEWYRRRTRLAISHDGAQFQGMVYVSSREKPTPVMEAGNQGSAKPSMNPQSSSTNTDSVESEFNSKWAKMVDKYVSGKSKTAAGEKWLELMHGLKEQWSFVWVGNHFTAGMHTGEFGMVCYTMLRRLLQYERSAEEFFDSYDTMIEGLIFYEKLRDIEQEDDREGAEVKKKKLIADNLDRIAAKRASRSSTAPPSQKLVLEVEPEGSQEASMDPQRVLGTRGRNVTYFEETAEGEATKIDASGEAATVYSVFNSKSRENHLLFWDMEPDIDERIACVFWADEGMQLDYFFFGDSIYFDTSYRSNKDHHPLADFDSMWTSMVEKYVSGKSTVAEKWLESIHGVKEQWSSAWVRKVFSASIHDSELSKQCNDMLRGLIQPEFTLEECLILFDLMVKKGRALEKLASEATGVLPNCNKKLLNTPIGELAAKEYTQAIYKLFQDEYEQSFGYGMTPNKSMDTGSLKAYRVFREESGVRSDETTVMVDHSDKYKHTCSCFLFESSGLLCRHFLRAMKLVTGEMNSINLAHVNIMSHYTMTRWTRKARYIGHYRSWKLAEGSLLCSLRFAYLTAKFVEV